MPTEGAASGGTHLVVVLYGHLGSRDGSYFHRPTIAGYLEGLAARVERLDLIARAVPSSATEARLVRRLSPPAMRIREVSSPLRGPLRGVGLALGALRQVSRAVRVGRRSGLRPVVLAFAPGPLAVGAALGRLAGRFPLVSYFGIDWDGDRLDAATSLRGKARSVRNRLLQAWIAGRSDATICAGRTLLDKIRTHCSDCHETWPILSPNLRPRDTAAARSREAATDRPSEPLRFLYVGMLSPRKGVDDLLTALSRLFERGISAHLQIVGTGPELGRLKERAGELLLEGRVEFTGYVSDPDELAATYAGSDVFVLPSRNEGLPRVLYEAAASGLPIVATSVGGTAASFAHGVNALIVPPGDVEALVAAMEEVCVRPEVRQRLSRQNLALALRFAGSDPVEQHVRILRSALERGHE